MASTHPAIPSPGLPPHRSRHVHARADPLRLGHSRGPFPQPPAPPRPDGHAAVYRRRDATVTRLYPLVWHHLETFLADAAVADPGGEAVPQWVEDDFRAYLRCGMLATRPARASGPTRRKA